MSQDQQQHWQLKSSKLIDGYEVLSLKLNGRTFCEYAPGVPALTNKWHSYFNGDPKQEFSSREACIANAKSIANQPLEVEL